MKNADVETTPEARARQRARDLTDLWWHAGTYVIVNVFLWILDFSQGGGPEWAFWVTVPWGIGLAFHALAYFLDSRGMEERKYREYLEEEQR